MGFAYLMFAMMILIIQEDTLETGLDEAYASFNKSAALFLKENGGLDSRYAMSKLVKNNICLQKKDSQHF